MPTLTAVTAASSPFARIYDDADPPLTLLK
jgi:hypothetical protein